GEFSVAAVPCWRIIDGEIKYAVKGVMLAGNIYELMNKIVLVGDKPRQVNNFILPKVAISDVQVVL
ncbi:MAG: metallopeptidase TldD-related protein, partial [archaeon GB-1867-035]|nr:metallopeptidase TldD-related protein [Candidatus Culexmicrobium profundum]